MGYNDLARLQEILSNNPSKAIVEYVQHFVDFRILFIQEKFTDGSALFEIIDKIGEINPQTRIVELPSKFEEVKKMILKLGINELQELNK